MVAYLFFHCMDLSSTCGWQRSVRATVWHQRSLVSPNFNYTRVFILHVYFKICRIVNNITEENLCNNTAIISAVIWFSSPAPSPRHICIAFRILKAKTKWEDMSQNRKKSKKKKIELILIEIVDIFFLCVRCSEWRDNAWNGNVNLSWS